jgi:hypothetical protein
MSRPRTCTRVLLTTVTIAERSRGAVSEDPSRITRSWWNGRTVIRWTPRSEMRWA